MFLMGVVLVTKCVASYSQESVVAANNITAKGILPIDITNMTGCINFTFNSN